MTVAEWIEAYGRAWRERDADAAAALFTEDAVYRSHPLREPHRGREGIHAWGTACVLPSHSPITPRRRRPTMKGALSRRLDWTSWGV